MDLTPYGDPSVVPQLDAMRFDLVERRLPVGVPDPKCAQAELVGVIGLVNVEKVG
jgi:hypothetical protein